tara:strand:+ start:260 stop:472 length:213 start_codon:yes stop_codon:yes gene_type:complete
LDTKETEMLHNIVDENFLLESIQLDDWAIIDLLWRKHLIVYDKMRTKKPEVQPWCRSNVLRALSSEQFGN